MPAGRAPRPRFASECRRTIGAALRPLGFVAAPTAANYARFDRGSQRVELSWDPYDVLLTIKVDGVFLSRRLKAAGLKAEERAMREHDPPLADVARVLVALVGAPKRARKAKSLTTCEHLEPLAQVLAKRRIALAGIDSPYDDDARWRWFGCKCSFDGEALRKRLNLEPCVQYVEYDGRVAGSDATFRCARCRCVIMGYHPRYAGSAPRVK
jgi:hypothetical protein